MIQAQMLLEALPGQRLNPAWQRWRIAGAVVLTVVGLIGLIGVGQLIAQTAIYGWQTTNWDRLDASTLLPSPFLFMIFWAGILLTFPLNQPPLGSQEAQRFLDTITAGYERLTPLAIQPEPLPSAELVAGPTGFRRLRAPASWDEIRAPALLAPLAFIPQQLFLAYEQMLRAFGRDYASPPFGLEMAILILPLVGLVAIMIRTAQGLGGRLSVTADDFGVTWWRGKARRTEAHAPWTSARSIFKVNYSSQGENRVAFLLDAGDAVLAWELNSGSKDEDYEESERLTRMIVTRTGLPLRDLSLLFTTLSQARRDPVRVQQLGLPAEVLASLNVARRRGIRRVWRGLAVTLPLLLLAVLIFIGLFNPSSRLQDYQQTYFAGLPPRILAQTPLFQDPLSYDDGNWFVAKPSASDNEASYAFVNSAYQLTGRNGQFVDSSIAPAYADAAVEVTARQVGQAPKDVSDGVGLELRQEDHTDNAVVFYISPTDGSWMLSHRLYNANHPDFSEYMDDGTSSAIQQGDGAVNRLLVLMRGSTFLLYINDRLIDAYTDRYHETHYLLPVGHVGVYLNNGATTGIFTNFAVYPVKSPPALSYV